MPSPGSLAGTGKVLGKKLEKRGFDKAWVVVAQFLVLKTDEDLSWNGWRTHVALTPGSPGTSSGASERGDACLWCPLGSLRSQAPPLSLWSSQPRADSTRVLYKGKDCCCPPHLRQCQCLLGVLSPHHFTFLGTSLSCMQLPSPSPASSMLTITSFSERIPGFFPHLWSVWCHLVSFSIEQSPSL